MGTQQYRANYRLAMQEANSQLAEIFREFEELQLRRELIEDVLEALDAFLPSTSPVSYQISRQQPAMSQPVRYEPEIPAPVAAIPTPRNEQVAPAPFAPVSEVADPIQNRINRALGLAVA